MSSYSFEFQGKTFSVKVPQGVSEEQAQALFKQQADTGSLVGIKVGEALSAATQAAAGLPGALAQLSQSAAGALGSLPAGANLNSITAGLGAAAGAAKGQISSALTGASAALNSLTTGSGALGSLSSAVTGAAGGITGGLSSAVTGAVGGITGGLSSIAGGLGGSLSSLADSASKSLAGLGGGIGSAVTGAVSQLGSIGGVSALTSSLTGAAADAASIASKAVSTLQGAIGGAATNGINVADFAKQIPSLGSLGSLSAADVQGTLAQASKLVGQGADAISNALGAGKFGFDAPQLEKAGLVKPGTAAAFLAQGANDLVSVLKSPTVWTGKDGVKSLDGLLNNPSLQDKVQQDLMKTGVDALKSLGVPTDKLSPQALSGLATNAAKSVEQTVQWATGAPNLPAEVKDKFTATAVNSAFAVNLTQTKVDPPVKQETKPEPAAATVNAETQDAAAKRVVGNDKVPSVSAEGGAAEAKEKTQAFLDITLACFAAFEAAVAKVDELEKSTVVTQAQLDAINAELAPARATYNSRVAGLPTEAGNAINALPPTSTTRKNLVNVYNRITNVIIPALIEYVKAYKQRFEALKGRITT